MENATKALLIAAAILIAIVLISLGVYVLGQGTTMVKDNSDMSDVEISTYNSKFEAYFGKNISGSKVKQLVNTVNQHNRVNKEDNSRVISITSEAAATGSSFSITTNTGVVTATGINTGNTYKVEIDTTVGKSGYTTGGLIAGIKITENN